MSALIKTKRRLKTIKSLNSIFTALQVITAARVQKVRPKRDRAKRYLAEMKIISQRLDFSFLTADKNTGGSLAVLISSNRGFCGAFNQNLLFRARHYLKEASPGLRFVVFGRKGAEFLHARKLSISDSFLAEEYNFSFFVELARNILRQYRQGQLAQVQIIFNHFKTVMRQDAVVRGVLPIAAPPAAPADNFLIEPNNRVAAEQVLGQLLAAELYYAYLDSQLGELSSRMFTLKNALENSQDLISSLSISMNKARQQDITRDLLEIIDSSESLKPGKGN